MEVGPEFTDAVSYESSPGHLGLTVPEVIVLLPRLLLNLAIRLLTSVTHIAGWLPGLFMMDKGLVFWEGCCRLWLRLLLYIQSGRCPFVYSASQNL